MTIADKTVTNYSPDTRPLGLFILGTTHWVTISLQRTLTTPARVHIHQMIRKNLIQITLRFWDNPIGWIAYPTSNAVIAIY